eukprot:973714_1
MEIKESEINKLSNKIQHQYLQQQIALAQQQYMQQLQAAQAAQQHDTANNDASHANTKTQSALAQRAQQQQQPHQGQDQAQQQSQQSNVNINQQRVTLAFNAISQIAVQVEATQAQLHSIVPQLTSLETQLQTPSTDQNRYRLETHYRAVSSAYEQHYRQYRLYLQQIDQLQTYLQQHGQHAAQQQQVQHLNQHQAQKIQAQILQAQQLQAQQQHAQHQMLTPQQLQQLNQHQTQKLQSQIQAQITGTEEQLQAQMLLQHASLQFAQQQQQYMYDPNTDKDCHTNNTTNNINVVNQLRAEVETHKERNASLQSQIDDLKDMMRRKDEELSRLQAEVETHKKGNASLQSQMDELKDMMRRKDEQFNRLQNEYKEMEMQLKARKEKKEYKSWNFNDVFEWIINLENGRFKHYEQKLLIQLKEENIDGTCLEEMDANDLHRLGVTQFKHKKALMKHIKNLTAQNNENGFQAENEGAPATAPTGFL